MSPGVEVLKEKEEKVKILIRLRREICVRGKQAKKQQQKRFQQFRLSVGVS